MNKLTIILALSLSVSGCASFQRTPIDPSTIAVPLVDMSQVKDVEKFNIDVLECQQYAATIDPAKGAGDAALTGLLLGLAVGSLAGDSQGGRLLGGLAGVGAGADSYKDGKDKQADILKKCLVGQGYPVIG